MGNGSFKRQFSWKNILSSEPLSNWNGFPDSEVYVLKQLTNTVFNVIGPCAGP